MNSERLKETEIGLIPEDWEIQTLKNLLRGKGYIRGPFGSALRRNELKSKGIPVYEQQHAIYNRRDFRYFIDEEKFKELSRFTVKERDLIISCSGNVGKISLIQKEDPKGIISQALLILRPNYKNVLPEYLRYFFTSKKGQESLISRSGGSVQVNLAKKQIIQEIKIPTPTINEQVGIIKVLSSIENKIKLNHQINQTLEEISRAIYRHWFVHFEFSNEEGRPYKSSGGKMVDSELGEIPDNWKVGTLGDMCELNANSWTPKSMPEEIHYVDLANTKNGIILDVQILANKDAPSRAKRILFPGDTIFGTVRPGNRSFTLIGDQKHQLTGSTGFAVLTPKNQKLREIVYLTTTSEENISRLTHLADGAAYPAVRPNVVTEEICFLPSETIINSFHEFVRPLFDHILSNQNENVILSKIRDSLLPKFMSGKIRVNILEEATAK